MQPCMHAIVPMQVISSQMGFVRVELYDRQTTLVNGKLQRGSPDNDATSSSSPDPLPRAELLCNIRSLLRKLKKNILVGDYVSIRGIDWRLGRGTVEDVVERQSETVDPAVANVDHALLVFALANPPVR
jgi:putative ribosome biogenesis GTPase RsgA